MVSRLHSQLFVKKGSTDQLPKDLFARFPSNSRHCPVEALRLFLKATRTIRPIIPFFKLDPLFISFVKRHKPITAPSLGRWLRMLLQVGGSVAQWLGRLP